MYERFVKEFTRQTEALQVGNGLAPGTMIGPLIDAQAVAKVKQHVSDAVAHGAHVLTGGHPFAANGNGAGTFWTPTVLGDARPEMLVAREETFGPVAPLLPFNNEAEVLRIANDTPFGLAAYFYTRDVSRVFRVAEQLEYGIIGANDAVPSVAQAPFGGVKQSGLGREGGSVGIDEYLDVKYISLGLA